MQSGVSQVTDSKFNELTMKTVTLSIDLLHGRTAQSVLLPFSLVSSVLDYAGRLEGLGILNVYVLLDFWEIFRQ